MNNSFVIIAPEQVQPWVFSTNGSVKVTAYGLGGGDCITFRKVEETVANSSYSKHGCHVSEPTDAEIALATEYRVGTCPPSLNSARNTLYIKDAGKYLPVIRGQESVGGLTVKVEPVSLRDFTAMELGIEPCGCPCVDTSWEWTGDERINGDVVERKFQSNCGNFKWENARSVVWMPTGEERCIDHIVNIKEVNEFGKFRWTTTDKSCGYSPSLTINDDVVGYIFDPNEPIDPAASVALTDCDGNVLGYAYPQADTGRTVKIEDCDGNVIAYAVNQSSTAPVAVNNPEGCCCNNAGNSGSMGGHGTSDSMGQMQLLSIGGKFVGLVGQV